MDDKENLEMWKRKKSEIESKIAELNRERNTLLNVLDEEKKGQNIKLSNCIKDLDLSDEISHIKEQIESRVKEISIYVDKIRALEIEASQEEILEREFKELVEEASAIIEKEKEIMQKENAEEQEIYIPSPEEIEKDAKELEKDDKK